MFLSFSHSICCKTAAEQNRAEICSLLYIIWKWPALKNEKIKLKKYVNPPLELLSMVPSDLLSFRPRTESGLSPSCGFLKIGFVWKPHLFTRSSAQNRRGTALCLATGMTAYESRVKTRRFQT